MPCDPYTEAGYFETIGKMAVCVERNVADLVLMGITPTYPSEKYGYVGPETDSRNAEGSMKVRQFTEKPNVERAKQLLSIGALWNGGVFAYRLGYLMDIVARYIKVGDFDVEASSEVQTGGPATDVIDRQTGSRVKMPSASHMKDILGIATDVERATFVQQSHD